MTDPSGPTYTFTRYTHDDLVGHHKQLCEMFSVDANLIWAMENPLPSISPAEVFADTIDAYERELAGGEEVITLAGRDLVTRSQILAATLQQLFDQDFREYMPSRIELMQLVPDLSEDTLIGQDLTLRYHPDMTGLPLLHRHEAETIKEARKPFDGYWWNPRESMVGTLFSAAVCKVLPPPAHPGIRYHQDNPQAAARKAGGRTMTYLVLDSNLDPDTAADAFEAAETWVLWSILLGLILTASTGSPLNFLEAVSPVQILWPDREEELAEFLIKSRLSMQGAAS